MRRISVAALLVLAAGCGWFGPREAGPVKADYDTQTGRLKTLTRDSNGDGKTDEWTYWDGTTALKGEFDKDFDGKPDRWEYYRGGKITDIAKVGISSKNDGIEDAWVYKGADGAVERVEISLQRNGKISRWEHYKGSVLVRAEVDSKGTGRPDKWEYFTSGVYSRIDFDLDGDGKIDRRLDYGPNGVTASRPK